MSLPSETLQHLARLARLDISEGEAERLARDLEGILDHARRLPPFDREPDPGAERRAMIWKRNDEPTGPAPPGAATSGAPHARDGFFTVPRTIDKHGS